MKQKLLLITLLISSFGIAQEIEWEKSYGGKQAEYLTDAIATADYGYILAGSSLSVKSGNKSDNNKGDLDYWIWKMKENGDPEWQKSFGGSGSDFLQSIDKTNDGGFILAGTSSSDKGIDKTENSRGGEDFWIIKLNAQGKEEWQKTIGGSGQEKLQTISQTFDGGYIIGGSSSSQASPSPSEGGELTPDELKEYGEKTSINFGNLDYWIVKIDKTGKIVWQKTYGGIYFDELRSIEQTKDGGYIVGGYSNSPEAPQPPKGALATNSCFGKKEKNIGIGDFWVLKIDKDGNEQWQKTIGGDQDDQLYVVHQTYDGNFIVGGNSNSQATDEKSKSNQSGTDFWVLKLNPEGKTIWQETYNIGEVDVLTSLVENKDHTILLGGFAQSELSHNPTFGSKQKEAKSINDFVAIKITENGEETWRKTVGSAGEDLLKKAIETRDGGYLLAGTSKPLPKFSAISGMPSGIAGSSSVLDSNQENQQFQNSKNEVKSAIGDVQKDINNGIKDKTDDVTKRINEALKNEENPFKLSVNSPTGGITLPSLGDGNSGSNKSQQSFADAINEKQGKKGTGDQTKVFGSNDFWVVKLRDTSKSKVEKAIIEAIPNPAITFTNIIVGYDFTSGTASLFDLAGRQLQSFAITSRTVPIDLSELPNGIYIININTNIQQDGIKVIKGNGKK
jgi:Secretion system C-terminal sorting domain